MKPFVYDFVRIIGVVAVFVGTLLAVQFVLAGPGEEWFIILRDSDVL